MFKSEFKPLKPDNIQYAVWRADHGLEPMGIGLFRALIECYAEDYVDGGDMPESDTLEIIEYRVDGGDMQTVKLWDDAKLEAEILEVAGAIKRERREQEAHQSYYAHQVHYVS